MFVDFARDEQITLINPFKTLISSNVLTNKKRVDKHILEASLVVGTILFSSGMVVYGQSRLSEEKADYNKHIAGFESIYSKGNAPIDLIERRDLFMSEQVKEKSGGLKLISLLSAISRVKEQMPELELTADSIEYVLKSEADVQTSHDGYDYIAVLRFKKLPVSEPKDELVQWQRVFEVFSKTMQGESSILISPITQQTQDGNEVLVMTIQGRF